MERGLITFFKVTECGFYRYKGGQSEFVEGGLVPTLEAVSTWLSGREVENTIPWDANKSPLRTQVFCKSIHHDVKTGDYLFVLWKKYADDSGSVNGILPRSKVGDTGKDSHKIKTQYENQNLILGEPMYYWFIPSANLVASIKFPKSLCDSTSVFDYIKRCMDLRIPHARKKESERVAFNQYANKDILVKNVSYSSADGSYSLRFKFNGELKELSINDAGLLELSKKITHLVVRETISTNVEVDKHPAFHLYDKVFGKTDKTINREKQVEIVTEQFLSVDELSEIIKTYNDEIEPDSAWNNIGFKSDGVEGQTKWFNSYVERKHINVDESSKKESYYPADVLLSVILGQRSSLIDFKVEVDSAVSSSG
ncbi:hypothetical protein [Rheinheimera sp.]|uniref:hypothetical protein n=1 Tax=Rheinheimera sp. TaxID=1869214 RepID=UPI0027B9BBAD|nr:hypothetical protein [Rheinheimera sp.]